MPCALALCYNGHGFIPYLFTQTLSVCPLKGEAMEKILAILKEIRPDVDFENEEKLIDDNVLDSFDIISIVGEFNDAFDIEINVEDLEPENFNTVKAMKELIERLQEG